VEQFKQRQEKREKEERYCSTHRLEDKGGRKEQCHMDTGEVSYEVK
jgi:hypothetical protein